MENLKVSMRYAKAIYPIAKQNGSTEELMNDMKNIITLIKKSYDFALLIKSPVIPSIKKMSIFDAVFKNKITNITYDFLKFLFEKNREVLIETIYKSFVILYNKENKIITPDIISANELDSNIKRNIEKFIENITKMKVQANYDIDKSLIGGMRIRIEDKVYDATIKSQLTGLRNALVK